MEHSEVTVASQRRLLLKGLGVGLLAMMMPAVHAAAAVFKAPPPLSAGKSVYRLRGRAWVNGKRVHAGTRIAPNDVVKTGRNSELVFVVGDQAMILRGRSHLVIEPKENADVASALIGGLRLFAGKLMSVSRNKGMRIETPTATIGIRGTGVYLEAGADKTYFCTCYGEVDVASRFDSASTQTVTSSHHDMPLHIYRNGAPGQCIMHANNLRVPNHTDDELLLAEALVGRVPPFAE